ncbi:MAG: hypothetical protein JO061_11850 [Acidobacteriaceae bacterium]|nr:hypothetical protein [Acidobacteriaceae bacterium]
MRAVSGTIKLLAACAALGISYCQPQAGVQLEKVRGRYTNTAYLYSVVVPPSVAGYRNAAPAPNHGFGIDLETDRSHIWVDGSFDVLDLRTSEAIAADTAKTFYETDGLSLVKDTAMTLSGIPARELTMQSDKPHAKLGFSHCVVAARPLPGRPVGIVYTICLQGRADNDTAENVFGSLVRSFQTIDLPE